MARFAILVMAFAGGQWFAEAGWSVLAWLVAAMLAARADGYRRGLDRGALLGLERAGTLMLRDDR